MNMYALPNFYTGIMGPDSAICLFVFCLCPFGIFACLFCPWPYFCSWPYFVLGLMLMSFCLVCRTLAIINPHSIGASNQIRPRLYFLAKMV